MNKFAKILCGGAMALFLAGCNGSAANTSGPDLTGVDPNLAGQYKLVSTINPNNEANSIPPEQLEKLESYGLVCTMNVLSDGTAVLDAFGEEETFKYDADHFYLYIEDEEGNSVPAENQKGLAYRLEDGVIYFTDEDSSAEMIFERIDNGLSSEIKSGNTADSETAEPAEDSTSDGSQETEPVEETNN